MILREKWRMRPKRAAERCELEREERREKRIWRDVDGRRGRKERRKRDEEGGRRGGWIGG